MIVLIVLSVILWLLTNFVYGFGFVSIACLITTGMFCARKIGVFVKPRTMAIIEILIIFLSLVVKLLFHKLVWAKIIWLLVFRIVFFCLVLWDSTQYIYVKEVHRKEE